MSALTRTFDSSSSSATYTATIDTTTGRGTCNCPGWTKRSVRECKHTKALAAEVGTSPTPAPAPTPKPVQGSLLAGPAQPTVKPQLASAMKDGQAVDDFTSEEWILEEKFDGHRIIVVVRDGAVSAWSRPGAEKAAQLRPLPAHLIADLSQLPSGQYDGELYIPGGTSSDVVRLDRKGELVYAMFDAIEVLGRDLTDLPLRDRRLALVAAWQHITAPRGTIVAEWNRVSAATIRSIWDRGGEGAILKRVDSTYRSGWRTPHWVKVKAIGSTTMVIAGTEPGKNGPHSVFVLQHEDGRMTTAKVQTDELIRRVNADPGAFVGRRVTMSFMGLTKNGLWRHPIFDHFLDGE